MASTTAVGIVAGAFLLGAGATALTGVPWGGEPPVAAGAVVVGDPMAPDRGGAVQPVLPAEPPAVPERGGDAEPVPDPVDEAPDEAEPTADDADEADQADEDRPDEDGLTAADRAAGLLGRDVPPRADGVLLVAPGSQDAPREAARVVAVRVEVEQGLPVDLEVFAEFAMTVLNDPRGWGGDGSVVFTRTDGPAPFRVTLASPSVTDELCAPLRTVGLYSCGRGGVAALNAMRWVEGAPEFDDMTEYRQYLVNHEVGHLLGHQHVSCPGEGQRAPIMQQQTISVAPCVPNGWPFPDAG